MCGKLSLSLSSSVSSGVEGEGLGAEIARESGGKRFTSMDDSGCNVEKLSFTWQRPFLRGGSFCCLTW